jgi:anti-sigma B factor antagonist
VTTSLCSCSERNMLTEFHVERIVRADGVRLVLSGELDLAGTDRLLSAGENVPEGGTLALDLSGLSFMDSSGLKVFMNLDRRSRREGWSLVIENPRGQVLRLLQLCGFEQRLPITPR